MTNLDVTINLEALADIYHEATMCEIYRNRTDEEKKRADELSKTVESLKARDAQAQKTLENLNKDILEYSERVKTWERAENAEKPIEAAQNFLNEHDTPFETDETVKACDVIRGLVAMKQPKTAQPQAFPKMSEELAASFDRASKVIKNADNPPPLVATSIRQEILDALKDIVHNVDEYFAIPPTTTETTATEELF